MPNHKGQWLILLLAVHLAACKKNDVPPPPVVEIIPAPVISMVLKPVTTPVAPSIQGYYVGLPSNYDSASTNYPLLVFLPGGGQLGNGLFDLPLLLKDGPAQLLDEKIFPSTFKANGKVFSMIVFTPQLKYWPAIADIAQCIEFIKSHYRIDSSRIYLSGLSLGGILSCETGANLAGKLAAIAPMAGVPNDYVTNGNCQQIAAVNLPVWVFHSADDPLLNIANAQGFVNEINSYNPAIPAKITIWPNGGHDAWSRALDPNYKQDGMNVYEWMLQFHR